jgi:SAM-dependent methyltransferase
MIDDDRTSSKVNPWLTIPAVDYEGHMASPGVAQLQLLSGLFADLLQELAPRDLAVLGCATGNGFEHIDPAMTRRIVGVDLNPSYLRIASERFARRLPGLELIEADLTSATLDAGAFDHVHCALVLEYVNPSLVVPRIAAALRNGATLSVVLQLPSIGRGTVSPSPYASLRRLVPIMRLVDPDTLTQLGSLHGLFMEHEEEQTLSAGKSFWIGRYRKL